MMNRTENFSGEGRIQTIRRQPEGYVDCIIQEPVIARNARPGQFVMLGLYGEGFDPLLLRPFDIVETFPDHNTFRLIIKIVGKVTKSLDKLASRSPLRLIGPLGAPIRDFGFQSMALLVRGCGAAAVLFFLQEAKKKGIHIHTVLSASTAEKLILHDEIKALSKSLSVATDDGSAGTKALGSDVLRDLLSDTPVERIYSCGGGPYYQPYLDELYGQKKPVYLFLESYMACGFGYCHGCAVLRRDGGYSLVCQDGPLFRLDEVEDTCLTYQ